MTGAECIRYQTVWIKKYFVPYQFTLLSFFYKINNKMLRNSFIILPYNLCHLSLSLSLSLNYMNQNKVVDASHNMIFHSDGV